MIYCIIVYSVIALLKYRGIGEAKYCQHIIID